ncbi:glycosyltransferase [Candidatus Chlorohelix sp.]|uniref:glycosyltransferase n=1 Tax=Candidatus Chlorohelix sp. TaxID=3139201 RepID=UPI00303FA3D5
MKVALVHDYLNQYGGAERVLEAIADMFPEAPIYTSIYDKKLMEGKFPGHKIYTSFMQRFPGVLKRHQLYLLAYSFAFEHFDLKDYDVVISSSSAWAKGVVTPPNTLHICYCHAPMRFAWDTQDYARRENMSRLAKIGLPLVMEFVRLWDIASAARPHFYVANSQTIAGRIKEYWGRDAVVINPPVEVEQIPCNYSPREDFYLMASRLMPYKRLDIGVKAFRELGLPLKIVGTGRDLKNLKDLGGSNIEFLGYVSDDELYKLFGRCKAFIQTGAEDFGITQVEAMAAGAPVIAIKQNGPAEVNVEGLTGLFFEEQSPQSLADTVQRFEQMSEQFDSHIIRTHAETFSREIFIKRFHEQIDLCVREFKAPQQKKILAIRPLNDAAEMPNIKEQPAQ